MRYLWRSRKREEDEIKTKQKNRISKEEYEELEKWSIASSIKDAYNLDPSKDLSIKIYKGKHKGLIRAEIDFESEDKAKEYMPLDRMWPEITEELLSRDKKFVLFSREEFEKELEFFS